MFVLADVLPSCHVNCSTRYVDYSGKADVIAQWKMVNPLYESFVVADVIYHLPLGNNISLTTVVYIPGGTIHMATWQYICQNKHLRQYHQPEI